MRREFLNRLMGNQHQIGQQAIRYIAFMFSCFGIGEALNRRKETLHDAENVGACQVSLLNP